MENLYNPDQMPQQEIKDTFVARQGIVERLVSLVRNQPEGAGVQHVVIVGPRGMGKTTLLLMIQLTVAEQGLTPPWQVIRFPEELYNVTDLAEFWLETARSLAYDAADTALARQIAEIQARYTASDDLREASLALLKDWCRTHKRRLLLLVDNLSLLLSQINDERENAGLRSVLMNDGFLMLIGAAPSIFREATGYDQALYNFFKIEHLENLTSDQTQDLLRRRAAADGIANFDQTLRANRARFRVLEYFTGGNPRLVLMLYRVLAQSEVLEVRQGLERLLDQVTPYYKDKMEILPPQQRKILDYIARESSRTHEGVTPSEIAKGARLAANVVSSQLKRLLESGYIRTANLRGRSSFYTLAEPLYAIWYQMRFGRDARQRMGWLISFLKGWYDAEELEQESTRLKTRFHEFLGSGRQQEARSVLEHRRYLVEAMGDTKQRIVVMENVIRDYLELKDTTTLKKEVLSRDLLMSLSPDIQSGLYEAGCITLAEVEGARNDLFASQVEEQVVNFIAQKQLGTAAYDVGDWEGGIVHFETALLICPKDAALWINLGLALVKTDKINEALISFNNAVEFADIASTNGFAAYLQGALLEELGQYGKALGSYNQAIASQPENDINWYARGYLLQTMRRYDESIADYDQSIKINPSKCIYRHARGRLFLQLARYEDALSDFTTATIIEPDNAHSWLLRGITLGKLGYDDEAIVSLNRALELNPDEQYYWICRGEALENLNRYQEALNDYNRAAEITKGDSVFGLAGINLTKFGLAVKTGNIEAARQYWYQAVENSNQLEKWDELAPLSLLSAADFGEIKLVKTLITETQKENEFFPLLRAIDYLTTNDKVLIEKLNPEMRGIVKEIVARLRPVLEKTHTEN